MSSTTALGTICWPLHRPRVASISPKRARSRSVRLRPPPANSAPVGSTVKYASCSAPSATEDALLEQLAQRLAGHAPEDRAERVGVHRLVGELLAMRDRLRERLQVVEERRRGRGSRPDARGNHPPATVPRPATSDRRSPRCSRARSSCRGAGESWRRRCRSAQFGQVAAQPCAFSSSVPSAISVAANGGDERLRHRERDVLAGRRPARRSSARRRSPAMQNQDAVGVVRRQRLRPGHRRRSGRSAET